MDIKYLLEKTKELLERDKFLMPVLFVETEETMNIIALTGDFNNTDKRKLMTSIGMKFAKDQPNSRIESLSMVSEANVSKIYMNKNIVDKCETIVVAKLSAIDNKKEIITQDFERSNNNITFKDDQYELDTPGTFLLEEFMKGYHQVRRKETKYN